MSSKLFKQVARLPRKSYSTATAFATSRQDVTVPPPPVNLLSENETFFVETVRKFSQSVVKPLVREMDKNSKMNPIVTQGAFENGVSILRV
ncbi:hypothetical protein CAEBREN_17717 [Caenorhabditis brenneri]|uniref:Acyl-CoA dehydrogenase/oxidase N-terminal domain-containing protein n=1 Tax=Caenorhabditis brenneri TaxID=135651 RepID=G0NZ72_CAEBE|nr:hypothetical protein CAEBREN_17717 [Caenorhabditis brenneri]